MATGKDKAEFLTLEIAGSRIPADKFRKGVNAFMSLIDEVVREFSGSKHNIRWIVSVSPGSAILNFEPEPVGPQLPPDDIPTVLDTIQSGLNTVEKSPQRPTYFNDVALKRTREIAAMTGNGEQGIDSIHIRRNGKKNTITTQTLANIDSMLKPASTDWGSLEGRLSEVSERGERHVYIYDRILDKQIRCHLNKELLEKIAPYWGKRVNVTGLIRYYAGGDVKDINVEEYEVFPDPHTLPGFDEVRGLFKELD